MHGKFTADQFALARIERNRRLLVLTHRWRASCLLVGVVVACPLPSWRSAAFLALFLVAFVMPSRGAAIARPGRDSRGGACGGPKRRER